MNYISDILYWISTGLLVPVIVLLIILFIRALILIGNFFGQYLSIRKTEQTLRFEFENLSVASLDDLNENLPVKNESLVIRYIRQMLDKQYSQTHLQRIVSDFEIAADKDLALSKTLTKMGPVLGLMGTLIPMGPALVGLSTGDIADRKSVV